MYLCVQAASLRLSLLTVAGGCWPQPQTQTPAGDQAWAQRRAAPWPECWRGRPKPTEPPANRATPPKPLSGKTGGRSGATVGEVK